MTTNLGTYDRLNVRLSTDGGASFPIVLAGSVAATDHYIYGFFVGDNFERFATDRFNDPRPW